MDGAKVQRIIRTKQFPWVFLCHDGNNMKLLRTAMSDVRRCSCDDTWKFYFFRFICHSFVSYCATGRYADDKCMINDKWKGILVSFRKIFALIFTKWFSADGAAQVVRMGLHSLCGGVAQTVRRRCTNSADVLHDLPKAAQNFSI